MEDLSSLRPRFKLDIRKYMYLLNSAENSPKIPNPLRTGKNDMLKYCHRYSNSMKIEEHTGNLHFHHDTLRHNRGEFTINRIFLTPKQIVRTEAAFPSQKRNKKKNLTANNQSITKLMKNAKMALERKRHSNSINPKKKPKNLNSRGMRIKSRGYLKVLYNATLV